MKLGVFLLVVTYLWTPKLRYIVHEAYVIEETSVYVAQCSVVQAVK